MSKKNQINASVWQWKVMEYISYFAIFIIPLVIGNSLLYSFSSSKSLLLTFLTLLAVIFYFWGSWNNKESTLDINPIHITLLLFTIILTISSVFGVDPLNSFFGWRYAVSMVYLYILSIFAILIGFLVKKNKDFLVNILTMSFMSSIIVTFILYAGLSFRTADGSTIGNSSYLGEYLFFNVLFGIGLFLYFKKTWKKVLIGLGTLFIVLSPIFVNKDLLTFKVSLLEAIKNPVLFFGIANGATLGLGISFLVMGLLFLIASNKKILKVVGGILLISFLFSIYYTGRQLVKPESNINKVYVAQKSGNRFLAWDIAKTSFLKSPLLGSGLNNYPYNYEKYFTVDFYKKGNSIERFNQPHNIFWEFASNTGILGLLSFLTLLIATFIGLFYRKPNSTNDFKNININPKDEVKAANLPRVNIILIVLGSILFGYFIQNLFVFDTISTYLMLFLIIGIAIGVSNISWKINLNEKFYLLKKIVASVVIFGSLVSMVIFVFLPLQESKQWGKMMVSTQNILDFYASKKDLQGISVMGGVFDSAFVADKLFGPYEDNLSKANDRNKGDFLKIIDYVVDRMENDTKIQPNYADTYFMIGNYLNLYMLVDIKAGEYLKFDGKNYNKEIWTRAFNALNKSIELNPNNPKVYLSLSKTYMIKGDIAEARIYAKKAIEVAPENKDAYKFSRVLLNIPDKDFEKYLNEMESKWVEK